jgi:uncharacterized SAM-binding protein YcdF (DUF218 family)
MITIRELITLLFHMIRANLFLSFLCIVIIGVAYLDLLIVI